MSVTSRRWSVLAALALSLALIGAGCTKNAEAWDSAQLINTERANRGIPGLELDIRLVEKAQAWADTMARRGSVSHSNLRDGVGSGWTRLAENVGWSYSVAQSHKLFMDSPSHRASILNRGYTKFGTGVAISGNKFYVVQVFGA
ncbi:MAG TPA: CAP domain-containing protein [Microthrixaceae bacterium]|nr:CAP domain-containing protein [Microthrixaceae bacterium]